MIDVLEDASPPTEVGTEAHPRKDIMLDKTMSTTEPISPAVVSACAAAALLLGLLTRIPHFIGLDFPLNDGGLFLAMAEAVRDAGFALPVDVHYNGLAIPFAYPPLSFFLAAGISDLSGIDLLSVELYLPLLFNLASIVLFAFVAAHLVDRPSTLFFATAALPLIPRSYEWLVMGGGLSRSPGFLLTLVSMLLAIRAARRRDLASIALCTFTLGLTLATHLEWGITAWVSTTLYMLSVDRSRRGLVTVLAMGLGMGIVTSPWWVAVVARHGLDPFLAASQTGGWGEVTFADRIRAFDVFTLRSSWIGLIAAAGFGVAIKNKHLLPPIWLLLIFITTPRHGSTAACMPVAILIGMAMTAVCDLTGEWIARLRVFEKDVIEPGEGTVATRFETSMPILGALAFVLLFGLIADDTSEHREDSPLIALRADERAGMEWVRQNTSDHNLFLVLSSAPVWESDRAAEWFPVLADRKSVNTTQGLEWLREIDFEQQSLRGDVLRQIATVNPSSAPIMGQQLFNNVHDHVVVFAPPGSPMQVSYRQSIRYELIHEEPAMSVFRLRPLSVGLADPLPSSQE